MDVEGDFADWYAAHRGGVLRSLTAVVGDPHAAGEATDEAFARALERWPRVREMESPTAWTYQTALNVARRRARRAALERRLLHRSPPRSCGIEPLDPGLWAAVRGLPERQRIAVALRYIADLSEPLIAEVMGVAVGTVSAMLHAARKRLAAELSPELLEASRD